MTDHAEPPKSILPAPPEDGIGERIRERRKELDLSVEELAALTALYNYESEEGVSAPTIYRYESKGSKPGARELRLLCEALNVSPSVLLIGEEWSREQEADTKIAAMLRGLIAEVSDKGVRIGQKSNQGRNDDHFIKLTEVKERRNS